MRDDRVSVLEQLHCVNYARCVPVRTIPGHQVQRSCEFIEGSRRGRGVNHGGHRTSVFDTPPPATDCPPRSAPTAPVDTEAWWGRALLVGVPGRNFSRLCFDEDGQIESSTSSAVF